MHEKSEALEIKERYRVLKEKIDAIASECARASDEIHIIAVSKTKPASMLQAAIDQGIMELGENKVQEVVDKIPQLRGEYIGHFIGHIQRNKAKQIVKYMSVFHSLDKLETAEALQKAWQKQEEENSRPDFYRGYLNIAPDKMGYFIQVNTTGELSKFGLEPDKTLEFAERMMQLESFAPLGLMTMGPLVGGSAKNREAFARLRELRDTLQKKISPDFRYLSMGMSADYPDAIKEGATHLRIGTAIFGHRIYA